MSSDTAVRYDLSGGRLPSLDGLRAVSISLVIIYHLGLFGAAPIIGNLGVRVFFVISGYLITRLLLIENENSGRISLKHFYLRRVLRIFPAFYMYWFVMALCEAVGLISLADCDLLEGATYTINYFPGASHALYVRHLWSLAVEEQFYLLWPMVLVLARRRWALRIAALFLILDPAIRFTCWQYFPSTHELMDSRFETVADALATGCLLAGVQSRIASLHRYNDILRSRWFLVLPLFIVPAAVVIAPHPRIYYGVGITFLNLSIAVCIDRFVRFPHDAAGALLNSLPFRTIGVLSYSIYIWQQPFLVDRPFANYQLFPLNLACVAVFSAASYLLVEQPILKRCPRFSHGASAVPA